MLGPRARLPIFSGRASLLTRMPLSSAARVYVCTLVLQACLSFLLMPPAYVSAYSVLTLLFIAVLSLTLFVRYPSSIILQTYCRSSLHAPAMNKPEKRSESVNTLPPCVARSYRWGKLNPVLRNENVFYTMPWSVTLQYGFSELVECQPRWDETIQYTSVEIRKFI